MWLVCFSSISIACSYCDMAWCTNEVDALMGKSGECSSRLASEVVEKPARSENDELPDLQSSGDVPVVVGHGACTFPDLRQVGRNASEVKSGSHGLSAQSQQLLANLSHNIKAYAPTACCAMWENHTSLSLHS